MIKRGLFLVLFLVLLAGCNSDGDDGDGKSPNGGSATTSNGTEPADKINPDSLFILYTYDTNGKLETCGCATRQLGGMARRGTIIEDYSENYKRNVLVLDGGKILPDNSQFSRFKAGIIIDMLNKMDYAALHLGYYEFNFDLKVLAEWADSAKFPLMSANVLSKGSYPTLVRPEILKENGSDDVTRKLSAREYVKLVTGEEPSDEMNWTGSPVVFLKRGNFKIGLISGTEKSWVEGLDRQNLIALPLRESFTFLMNKYGDEADIWIAMVEANNHTIRFLMDDFPGIKIWLSGNPKRGEAVISHEATELGQLWQNIFQDGKYIGITSLDKRERNIFITQEEKAIPDSLEQRADLNSIMINDYRPELEKIFKLQKQPIGRRFVVSMNCINCHKKEFDVWQSSKHAQALTTLTEKGQNWNLDCVSCHVEFDELNDVQFTLQCTTCHYQSWESHIQEAVKSPGSVSPLDEVIDFDYCISCHTEENSPEFAKNYRRYFEEIKHWDGPVVPGEELDSE